MTLCLVRHAQPLVAPGLCYGAWDVPADPQATRQAAQTLASALPRQLQVISSPLQRCERLAHAVQALRPDLTYETDARLAEMNFGAWEGQAWDAIARAELDAWTDDFARWRCGGGDNVQDFMARVAAAWDASVGTRQPTVWITHAGVIRAARLLAQGQRTVQHAAQWPREACGFGQWCEVQTT